MKPEVFAAVQSLIESGVEPWNKLETPKSLHFRWNRGSTCVQRPKYFGRLVKGQRESTERTMTTTILSTELTAKLAHCRAVVMVGDSFSSDHISLAGSIERDSAAGKWNYVCYFLR